MTDHLLPVWLGIGMVLALVVGVAAGTLAWLSGKQVPAAVLAGGTAFAGTITLIVLVLGLLSH